MKLFNNFPESLLTLEVNGVVESVEHNNSTSNIVVVGFNPDTDKLLSLYPIVLDYEGELEYLKSIGYTPTLVESEVKVVDLNPSTSKLTTFKGIFNLRTKEFGSEEWEWTDLNELLSRPEVDKDLVIKDIQDTRPELMQFISVF